MEDSIISPILTRDILEIEEIRNPALLRQVFELACIESAKELSLTKILQKSGIQKNEVIELIYRGFI